MTKVGLCSNNQASIEMLFQQYTKAFDALDANAIANLYMLPCSTLDVDGAKVFTQRKTLVDKFHGNCKSMRLMGYQYSEFNILGELPMGNLSKTVDIGWRVYIQNGEIEFRAQYVCHYKNDKWLIFNVSVYEGRFDNVV